MFKEQLKKYRKLNGYTQTDLANRLTEVLNKPFGNEHIRAYESGTNPKLETIEELAKILNIPIQYLFDDTKSTINKIVNKEIYRTKDFIEQVKQIPLLDGYAGAGSVGLTNGVIEDHVYIDNSFINKPFKNKDVKAIQIIGDSMSPYVNSFDVVFFTPLDPMYTTSNGKYIIETAAGLMLKNVSFKCNGDIVISSENPAYEKEVYSSDSQEHFKIIGFVIGRVLKS